MGANSKEFLNEREYSMFTCVDEVHLANDFYQIIGHMERGNKVSDSEPLKYKKPTKTEHTPYGKYSRGGGLTNEEHAFKYGY